jgi:GT2 family glycosyltransferase
MRHPAIMCCFQNLSLTKEAVASVFAQDIPVELWIVDNGSDDGTFEWLEKVYVPEQHSMIYSRCETNESPVKVANDLLRILFEEHEYVLGLPNDVILPPGFYREMLKWPRGIVTASMTDDKSFVVPSEVHAVSEHTPIAVALIRRWAYKAIVEKDGHFLDPRYFLYASDCDLALRLAACGIRGIQLSLPYYHFCSATLRRSPSYVAEAMTKQADEVRAKFVSKWGFSVDSAEYGERCGDINFRGESA